MNILPSTMMYKPLFFVVFLNVLWAISQETMQETLPYYEIPEAPQTLTAGAVMSRIIDGLGFRYYWATEGLTENELHYLPGNKARTIAQTIDHMYQLSNTILKFAQKEGKSGETPKRDPFQQRKATLLNFKKASVLFRSNEHLTGNNPKSGDSKNIPELPFWNYINGPIADALWHTGQITTLRRVAGNPIRPNLDFFRGKVRD
ncbi:MAG: hypothetical protein AAFX53_06415 [Bacteroidota bacterium]